MSRPPAWPLLPLAVGLALALAACGGSGRPSPVDETPSSALPRRTPSPGPESGGLDGFRAFASQIEEAVAAADGAFFARRGLQEKITCSGDEALSPCLGRPEGTVLRGIRRGVAGSEAFALLSPAAYGVALAEWLAGGQPGLRDGYGSGEVVLYALAHHPTLARERETYQAILTGIFPSRQGGVRQARVLSFQFQDGRWRLSSDLLAPGLQAAADWLSGNCGRCYDFWERWEGETP